MGKRKSKKSQEPTSVGPPIELGAEDNETKTTDWAAYSDDLDPTAEVAVPAESRNSPRSPAELKAVVQFFSGPEKEEKEVTKVTTISKTGAGFGLPHPILPGCLVRLTLPMPAEMRAYDATAELYSIIGLVQYCQAETTGQAGDDEPAYHVGVAFAGKDVPDSYYRDPEQSYRISGVSADGLWKITESDLPFKSRAAARFSVPLEVTVSVRREETRSVDKEQAITTNISSTGACLTCALKVEVGERVKFACRDYNFYALAVVRNRREKQDTQPVLHIEFVDSRFPVEKIVPDRHEAPSSD